MSFIKLINRLQALAGLQPVGFYRTQRGTKKGIIEHTICVIQTTTTTKIIVFLSTFRRTTWTLCPNRMISSEKFISLKLRNKKIGRLKTWKEVRPKTAPCYQLSLSMPKLQKFKVASNLRALLHFAVSLIRLCKNFSFFKNTLTYKGLHFSCKNT